MRTCKNKLILGAFLLAIALGFVLISCNKNKPIGKFNKIIFVTIDTLRADHLKEYGYLRETSPFLSSLISNGVKFTNSFSASSHTSPSHATMFTSLFPYEHKLLRNHDTLNPKLFHLRDILTTQGYEQGIFPSTKFLEKKIGFPTLSKELDLRHAKINQEFFYRLAEPNVDRAINWLKKKNNPEKYFLWLHFYDVHEWAQEDNKTLPLKYLDLFPKAGSPEAEDLVDFIIAKHNIPLSFYNNNRTTFYEAMTRYDARLRYVDDQLKRLADYIASNSDNDTLWIVTSDHGEGLGNHNYSGHGELLYQEQLHIPLIFYSNKGRIPEREVMELVRTVDYLPTLMDLTGYSPRSELKIQGLSLLPLLTTGKWSDKRVVSSFAERRPKDSGTLRNSWEAGEIFSVHDLEEKYIHHTEGDNEFYDLQDDPFEERSLGDRQSSLKPNFKNKVDELINLYKGGARTLEEQKLEEKEIEELKTLGYM